MRSLYATVTMLAFVVVGFGSDTPVSGLRPGEEVSVWEPIHEAGPFAGTKTCPVCTYLEAPVLLAFAKDIAAAEKLAKPLEEIATAHAKGKLKVMLVVVDGSSDALRQFAKDQTMKNVMLCRPDPERREKQLKAYKVNPTTSNTVILYQDYIVKKTWAELAPAGLSELKTATDPYLPKR